LATGVSLTTLAPGGGGLMLELARFGSAALVPVVLGGLGGGLELWGGLGGGSTVPAPRVGVLGQAAGL
jgi:hypothetical protein